MKSRNKFSSLLGNRSTDIIITDQTSEKFCDNLTFYAVRDRKARSREKFPESGARNHRSQTVDIGDRDGGSGSVVSRNCTFERDDRGVHGTLRRGTSALRAGNWITVPRYQLRKTSVHALTTSHVLTYDGRGVNGYATGSRWIWVAALNPHHRFCSVPA